MAYRAFISVHVDCCQTIHFFQDAINQTGAPVMVVDPENLHITFHFLGDIDDDQTGTLIDIMRASVDGIDPFTLNFEGTGAFPNRNYMKVLWVGISKSEELLTIYKSLKKGLRKAKIQSSNTKFNPHLTIARVKGKRHKERLTKVLDRYDASDFGIQKVNEIRLMKSVLTPSGPEYSIVAKARL